MVNNMDPHAMGTKEDKQSGKKKLVCVPNKNCTTPVRSSNKVLNKKEHMDNCLELLKFVADSDLTLTQVNGQRKLGPPSKWIGPPPSPKCEVFVGSIPRDYYEPEIVKIFSSVGQIYELRLMMDFSGSNRGYCFIMYTTEEEALRAVKELDQYEIYPGKRIGVVASVNNRRLNINHLSPTLDTPAIVKRFYEITDDIESVSVYRNINRFVSYVLVSYNTHRGAAMGRRRLVPESLTLFPNCEVIVEWANPNMTPWNVYEERCTCDAVGNVQVQTFSLMPRKLTKFGGQSKQPKIMDKRLLTTTSRSMKAVAENLQRNLDRSSNPCTLEQCQLNNRAGPIVEFRKGHRVKHNGVEACDVNGNLGNTSDQSFFHDNIKKNCVQHQQNMILPSISAFLKKRKGPRCCKVNAAQRCSNEAQRCSNEVQRCSNEVQRYSGEAQRYFDEAFASDASLINNRALTCSCQCRSNNLIPKNVNLDWNSVQHLLSNFSRVVLMPNSQILLVNNVDSAPNIVASQPPTHPNHPFVNHFQYGNYCQNYPVMGQNDAMPVHLPDQIPEHAYDVRPTMLNPSREYLPQQFLPGNMNSVVLGQNDDWCYSSSIPDQLCQNRNFPEYVNGTFYQTNGSQNAQEVTYSDKEISRGSILSTPNFDDPYVCKTPARSLMFGNDGNFNGNKQSIGEYVQGEEKFPMRPILKVTNADVKTVNY